MSLIKKGDKVWVIAGKHPHPTAPIEVLEVDTKKDRVTLDGYPMRKRHEKMRPSPEGGQLGGIIEEPRPIHISNIMFADPETNKPVRLGIKVSEDGTKKRVTIGRNSSNSEVD